MISTYVSRHFSERVPGLMTRVRLPMSFNSGRSKAGSGGGGGGDAVVSKGKSNEQVNMDGNVSGGSGSGNGTSNPIITIIDTQSSNVESLLAAEENVEAVVLVYDLDRPSTFQRLEGYWLPLLERCFSPPPAVTETPNSISGPDDVIDYNQIPPVVIAGNKLDLALAAPPTQEDARVDRQQIVALLQRFKFVRHCIKTSAKTLLNVNDIFVKTQEAVLFPIWPLYDLTDGAITNICKKAFIRVFRMFDSDKDGLLSDLELCNFQARFFKHPILDKHIQGWKKVLMKNKPAHSADYIREDKFTVDGFLAMIEMFMLKDFWEVPWTILRHFGYDDNLVLEIPQWINDEYLAQCKLSAEDEEFLVSLFTQFDSNNDGELSEKDIQEIFSIIPSPSLPPWHPARSNDMFQNSFSTPSLHWYNDLFPSPPSSVADMSINEEDEDAGVTILSSHETSSSLHENISESGVGGMNISHSSPPTSFAHPTLSFVDWLSYWLMVSSINPVKTKMEMYHLGNDHRSTGKSSSVLSVRINIFGNHKCGKTALLNSLVGGYKDPLNTEETETPQTKCSQVSIPRARLKSLRKNAGSSITENALVHVILTEVPSSSISSPELTKNCDLAVFAFDCTDEVSYKFVETVEAKYFNDNNTPRVFVGTKKECIKTSKVADDIEEGGVKRSSSSVVVTAQIHCENLELEPPMLTSASSAGEARSILEHFVLCAIGDLRSQPFADRRRREAEWQRQMIRLGCIVGSGIVGIAGFAAIGYFWPYDKSKDKFGFKSLLQSVKDFFGFGRTRDSAGISSVESNLLARSSV